MAESTRVGGASGSGAPQPFGTGFDGREGDQDDHSRAVGVRKECGDRSTCHRVALELINHWPPYKQLRQQFAGTRRDEELHQPPKCKATTPDSSLSLSDGDGRP